MMSTNQDPRNQRAQNLSEPQDTQSSLALESQALSELDKEVKELGLLAVGVTEDRKWFIRNPEAWPKFMTKKDELKQRQAALKQRQAAFEQRHAEEQRHADEQLRLKAELAAEYEARKRAMEEEYAQRLRELNLDKEHTAQKELESQAKTHTPVPPSALELSMRNPDHRERLGRQTRGGATSLDIPDVLMPPVSKTKVPLGDLEGFGGLSASKWADLPPDPPVQKAALQTQLSTPHAGVQDTPEPPVIQANTPRGGVQTLTGQAPPQNRPPNNGARTAAQIAAAPPSGRGARPGAAPLTRGGAQSAAAPLTTRGAQSAAAPQPVLKDQKQYHGGNPPPVRSGKMPKDFEKSPTYVLWPLFEEDMKFYLKDDRGNEFLDKRDYDKHPGSEAHPALQKDFAERRGMHQLCMRCKALSETCSRSWPCSCCKASNSPCKYVYDSTLVCHFGVKCQDLHPDSAIYLAEISKVDIEVVTKDAIWSFPDDALKLGGRAVTNAKGKLKSKWESVERGIALPRTPKNPSGYDGAPERWVYDMWIKATLAAGEQQRMEAKIKEKEAVQAIPTPAPRPQARGHTQRLREVPPEKRHLYGANTELFLKFDPQGYLNAVHLERNKFAAGNQPHNAAMPGDEKKDI